MISDIIYIGNPQKEKLFFEDLTWISSSSDFNSFFEDRKNLSPSLGLIIQAEIKWTNRYFTNFVGFDLIYKIRVIYNLNIPIILTTFHSDLYQDFVLNKEIYEYQRKLRIFRDPSIKFAEFKVLINYKSDELLDFFPQPLDNYLLSDLIENVYEMKGYLKEFSRELEHKLNVFSESLTRQKFIEFLNKNFANLSNSIPFLTELEMEEYKLPVDKLIFEKPEAVDYLRGIVMDLSMEADKSSKYRHIGLEKVKTLYISNEMATEEGLTKNLSQLEINLIQTDSSTEGIQTLRKQKDIGVILLDFRFIDEQKILRWEQGYHIYEKIVSETKKYFEYIVLINFRTERFPRFFVRWNVTPFPKELLVTSNKGYIRLAQLILEKAATRLQKISQLPVLDDAMELYYRYKADSDFDKFEDEISSFAIDVIFDIVLGKKGGLPMIENISGNLKNSKPSTNFFNFKIKLKARRLALGLYQLRNHYLLDCNQEEKWSIICSVLRTGTVAKTRGNIKNRVHSFLSSHLLKLRTKKNYHWSNAFNSELQLTPEERQWLYDYGSAIEQARIV